MNSDFEYDAYDFQDVASDTFSSYPEINNYFDAETFSDSIPETIAPEISPYSNEGRNYTENYVPAAVQNLAIPTGGNFSDTAGSLIRGVNNLVGIYGNVLSLDAARENQRVNRDIAKNESQIARIKSDGQVKVITAQQEQAVNTAVKKAEDAKNGSVINSAAIADNKMTLIIGVAGLAIAIYYGSKGKK